MKRLSMRATLHSFHIAKWLATIGLMFVDTFPTDMQVLVVFVSLDFLTGLASAYNQKKLDSEMARKGFINKLLLLVTVWAIHIGEHLLIDHVRYMGWSGLGRISASYYTVVEFLSILENYSKAGGNLPSLVVVAMVNARKFLPKSMTPEEVRKALDAGIVIDTEVVTKERTTMTAPKVDPDGKAKEIIEKFRNSGDSGIDVG